MPIGAGLEDFLRPLGRARPNASEECISVGIFSGPNAPNGFSRELE
jgi:hypothetical protein